MGSLLHGLGSGAIDTGLNHYVANRFSARHMNWLHAAYSVGAMMGPALMTWALTARNSFRFGYAVVAGILFSLSIVFFLTRRLWSDQVEAAGETPSDSVDSVRTGDVLRLPAVWLHILLFFIYTGLEVAVGQWSFTVLTEARGMGRDIAGFWVTVYWGGILVGRVLFGFVVDRMRIDSLIRWSTIAALAGTGLFAWNPTKLASPIALALAGLGLAVIFPCLMTRTPQRFGKAIGSHAIGFQVGAAMLGAAALPSLAGFIAQWAGVGAIPIILLAMSLALYLVHEIVLKKTSS
jgi:fucose permease